MSTQPSNVTVAELQAIRDTMIRAMGNPRLRARGPDGQEIQYRSMDELLKAKSAIEALIQEVAGTNGSSVSVASFSKALKSGPGWPRPGGNW